MFDLVLWHINHCRLFIAKSILYIKTVLFQAVQFSISTQFGSIWPLDRTLSGATTPGHSGPGSDGNKGVLRILQSSSIIRTSLSDCLVSYTGQSLGSLQIISWFILRPQPTGPDLALNDIQWLIRHNTKQNLA